MISNWNGDGLPPVGTHCETLRGNFWKPCDIVAHVNHYGEIKAVFQLKEHWDCSGSPNVFRPIKSDRDKAIEDMMSTKWKGSLESFCECLYDAGYRKQSGE